MITDKRKWQKWIFLKFRGPLFFKCYHIIREYMSSGSKWLTVNGRNMCVRKTCIHVYICMYLKKSKPNLSKSTSVVLWNENLWNRKQKIVFVPLKGCFGVSQSFKLEQYFTRLFVGYKPNGVNRVIGNIEEGGTKVYVNRHHREIMGN